MEIRIAKGDSRKYFLRIHDLYIDDRLNLEGLIIYFTVKKKLSDGDEEILIAHNSDGAGINITDAEKGEALLQISPEDTDLPPGDYWFDIRATDSGGNEVTSNYPNAGTLTIYEVVRQAFTV